MSQKKELEYILGELIPQFEERLEKWNKEYTQERDLGVKGEFVGLYRKVRKLKSVLWDGVDGSEWREDTRTILLEVIGHAFLALYDMDQERPPHISGMNAQQITLTFNPHIASQSKKEALEDLRRASQHEDE